MNSSDTNDQLRAIENRLSRIETYLNISKTEAAPAPTPSWTETKSVKTTPEPHASSSGRWLAIVAVICFILAAGFIVKLSIESGWLTPERQMGLAILFGFTLIGSGMLLLKTDREYASYLPASGIIVFYITVFAAYRLYELISFYTALVDVGIVSIICIWLYTEIKHDVYPIIAAVGAYISPILLDLHTETTFALYYFVICSVAFSIISILLKSRLLIILSAYLGIGITAMIGLGLRYSDQMIVAALMANFFIFTLATFIFSVKHKVALTSHEAWAFFPVLLLFYASEYYFINNINHDMAPWISLSFAAFLGVLYLWGSNQFKEGNSGLNSLPMILAFATVVAFHSIYMELIPEHLRPWLFVIIMVAFGLKTPSKKSGEVFFFPLMALIIILSMEYLEILVFLASKQYTYRGFALGALASMWFVIIMQNNALHNNVRYYRILLGAAHFMAVVAFYQLTYEYNTFVMSLTWLIYAVGVILYAYVNQDKLMAKSAIFVLAFAAGKALLYDASSAPTVIRILCLLITGAALYGSGFLIRKIDKWQR